MKVKFYDEIDDKLLKFAVIVSKYNDKWVFCKHKERDTYEIPGGHREKDETIEMAAKRELYEETGALNYTMKPVCVYSVVGKNRVNDSEKEMFGMLYYADIYSFEDKLHSEIEKIYLLKDLPEKWTYPQIQPLLLNEVLKRE